MTDLVCLGEALIDMFPLEHGRRLVDVSAFRPVPGGAPANVAVAAARQGARSAFIGKVGDDPFGHHLAAMLAQQGVDTHAMRFDPEARTGLNFHAQVDEHTTTHLFYRNPSADMLLRSDELERALLQGTRAFSFGSISLIQEPSQGATRDAILIARDAGALIAFDVNYRPGLWPGPDAARDRVMELLPFVDVVKLNEDEAALLTGSTDLPTILERLALLKLELCVITLGSAGSAYCTAAASGQVPGFSVQAVDTTGCGDAFTATLLLQLLSEPGDWRDKLTPAHLERILRRANAAGALTSLTQGVFAALPTRESLEQFLQQHPEPNQ